MKNALGSLADKLPALKQAMVTASEGGMFKQAVLSVSVGSEYWATLSFVNGMESSEGEDRLFDTASMTKTVVAFMVHVLLKNGVISLDTTVGEVFRGTRWKISSSVSVLTVRELLVHGGYFKLPPNFKELVGDEIIGAILECEVERGIFVYANTCYFLLGAMLEERTGKNLQELYHKLFAGKVYDNRIYWSRLIPKSLLGRIVPTWSDGAHPRHRLLDQIVHDPTTQRLHRGHSLSGAAGIFTSAPTLTAFFREVLWGDHEGGLISTESKEMLGINAVGHMKRPDGSKDTTSPVFGKIGMNIETRSGLVLHWSAGHTGCHGLIQDDHEISSVIMTDAVRYGEESRVATRDFFRKTLMGILIPN